MCGQVCKAGNLTAYYFVKGLVSQAALWSDLQCRQTNVVVAALFVSIVVLIINSYEISYYTIICKTIAAIDNNSLLNDMKIKAYWWNNTKSQRVF